MENTNNDDLLFKPEKNEKKIKNIYIKYSAIGLLTVILIGSIYYFTDNSISNQKVKEIEIAQKKIKTSVQKATFDLGKLSKVELNIKSTHSNKSLNSLLLVKFIGFNSTKLIDLYTSLKLSFFSLK